MRKQNTSQSHSSRPHHPRRVLVVDDEKSIRTLLQEYFEIIGLEARTVASGEEGLKALHEENFGLVLCDVSMPGMDGFQVFEKVMKTNPQQKFLFISGYIFSESRKSLVEKSLGLLRKPFHMNDLKAVIASVFPDIQEC